MRDILKHIPKKNCKVGFIGFTIAAGLSGAAAIFYAKSPQPSLAVVLTSVTMIYSFLAALFLRKWRQR